MEGWFLLLYYFDFLVGVYGKGFPVDSSPCIYLIFLLCPVR